MLSKSIAFLFGKYMQRFPFHYRKKKLFRPVYIWPYVYIQPCLTLSTPMHIDNFSKSTDGLLQIAHAQAQKHHLYETFIIGSPAQSGTGGKG